MAWKSCSEEQRRRKKRKWEYENESRFSKIAMGVGFFVVNGVGDLVFGYGTLDVEEGQTVFCDCMGELQGWMEIVDEVEEILQLTKR